MQKWEYMIVQGDIDEAELNRLGADGWALVGVATKFNAHLVHYFRRARS